MQSTDVYMTMIDICGVIICLFSLKILPVTMMFIYEHTWNPRKKLVRFYPQMKQHTKPVSVQDPHVRLLLTFWVLVLRLELVITAAAYVLTPDQKVWGHQRGPQNPMYFEYQWNELLFFIYFIFFISLNFSKERYFIRFCMIASCHCLN